jgi:DNA-directed RNA polymerase sigma subunit (sigma70/sigma32)
MDERVNGIRNTIVDTEHLIRVILKDQTIMGEPKEHYRDILCAVIRDTLQPKERYVIEGHYGTDKKMLRCLAITAGVTSDYISHLHQRALRKLRDPSRRKYFMNIPGGSQWAY